MEIEEALKESEFLTRSRPNFLSNILKEVAL